MTSRKKRSIGHPASIPTTEELLATRELVNRAAVDFLKVDVETALTFLFSARNTDDKARQKRNRKAARRAYDTVTKLMRRVKLSDQDARTIIVGLEQLRSELQDPGEVF